MTADPIRVLIVDDQRVVRDDLTMLVGLIEGVEVIGTASDGVEALARAKAELSDVVLMDLRMPHMEGAQATREIVAALPDTRVLVLTTYADDESLFPALQAGARGYLPRTRALRRSSRRSGRWQPGARTWIPWCNSGCWRLCSRQRAPPRSQLNSRTN
jgi:DNA-binding NarL/FixJ family response regulator